MYKRVWELATLSIGVPVGELGAGSFSGSFERLMEGSGNGASLFKLIWAPFYPYYVRSRVLGQFGTSVKNQGSHDLASGYGAQRACFKA
jgi:hypothetical protein